MRLVYRKGYAINFESLNTKPDFNQYHLEELGTWLSTSGFQWLCTSEITDTEEFKKEFFEETDFSKEEVSIETRHYPFVLFYG